MERGLIHLYTGTGKGKTTAAMGLALRALGHGRQVTVLQFLKDGQSGELEPLRRLGAQVCPPVCGNKFVFQMTEAERRTTRQAQTEALRAAAAGGCDVLILDEACAACVLDMVDEALLKRAVLERPAGREVVLTGRDPAPWMIQAADYMTVMCAEKHPFDAGVPAREGVEY